MVMRLFHRSRHVSVNPLPSVTLPPEIWELVCSFLPKKEVCRLRSLNRSFLSAALTIHYGTLTLETDDRQFRSSLMSMKFRFDMVTGRPYRRQYMLDHVHTLCLANIVAIAPFYSSKTRTYPSQNGGDFRIAFATESPRLAEQQLGCLKNVQNLHILGLPFSSKTFGSILIHSVARTLVHLDLGLMHLECIDLSSLSNTVLCPNVRSLRLSVNEPDNTITVPLSTFLEQGIQRIHSLIPTNIESMHLLGHLTSDLSYSIPLGFFNQLKELTCTSTPDATAHLPFAISELINNNAGTLVDIEVDLTALPVEYYEELDWREQVHTLSLSALAFYQKRHLYLPRLERCQNIQKLSLEGNLSDDNTVDLEAFHQSLLIALSQSSTQLNHLEIPFRTVTPRRVWDIACAFPNLDTLILHGVADPQHVKLFRLMTRIYYNPIPRGHSPKISFDGLQISFLEIRKRMGECPPSDFWHDHATDIVKALTSRSALVNQ